MRITQFVRKAENVRNFYEEIAESLKQEIREKVGVIAYYILPYVDRPKNLCGCIVPSEELINFSMFVISDMVYKPEKCLKYVAVNANAKDVRKIIMYGLDHSITANGKILRKRDGFYLSKEKLLSMPRFGELPNIGYEAVVELKKLRKEIDKGASQIIKLSKL